MKVSQIPVNPKIRASGLQGSPSPTNATFPAQLTTNRQNSFRNKRKSFLFFFWNSVLIEACSVYSFICQPWCRILTFFYIYLDHSHVFIFTFRFLHNQRNVSPWSLQWTSKQIFYRAKRKCQQWQKSHSCNPLRSLVMLGNTRKPFFISFCHSSSRQFFIIYTKLSLF